MAIKAGFMMTRPTFISMCRKNGFGVQLVHYGDWSINREKLVTFLESRRTS